MEYRDDTSRLDAFLEARQRAMTNVSRSRVLQAVALPMLAGMAGMGIIAIGIWGLLPVFHPRIVEVPVLNVTHTPVTMPDITMKPVEIPVPRVEAAPQSKEAFVASPEYRMAELSGRIAGAYENGFRFEDGQTFSPARIVNGRIEPNASVFDDVSELIGAPAYCAPQPNGLYVCRAWREGFGVVDIPVRPVVRRPTRAPAVVVARPEAIEARR
jgi:hypothetical protein